MLKTGILNHGIFMLDVINLISLVGRVGNVSDLALLK